MKHGRCRSVSVANTPLLGVKCLGRPSTSAENIRSAKVVKVVLEWEGSTRVLRYLRALRVPRYQRPT